MSIRLSYVSVIFTWMQEKLDDKYVRGYTEKNQQKKLKSSAETAGVVG